MATSNGTLEEPPPSWLPQAQHRGTKEMLNCVFCDVNLKKVRNPKLLPCLHSCCVDCIPQNEPLSCKLCKQSLDSNEIIDNNFIPKLLNYEPDLADEPGDSEISGCAAPLCVNCDDGEEACAFCQDCGEYLCVQCCNAHKITKVTKGHSIVLDKKIKPNASTTYCDKHFMEPLYLYCVTCDKLTCRDCQLMDHCGHCYQFLNEAYSIEWRILDKLSEDLEKKRRFLTKAIKQNEELRNECEDMERNTADKIKQFANNCISQVNIRGTELLLELESKCNDSRKRIVVFTDAIKLLVKKFDYVLRFCRLVQNLNGEEYPALYLMNRALARYSRPLVSSKDNSSVKLTWSLLSTSPKIILSLAYQEDPRSLKAVTGEAGRIRVSASGFPFAKTTDGEKLESSTANIKTVERKDDNNPHMSNDNEENPNFYTESQISILRNLLNFYNEKYKRSAPSTDGKETADGIRGRNLAKQKISLLRYLLDSYKNGEGPSKRIPNSSSEDLRKLVSQLDAETLRGDSISHSLLYQRLVANDDNFSSCNSPQNNIGGEDDDDIEILETECKPILEVDLTSPCSREPEEEDDNEKELDKMADEERDGPPYKKSKNDQVVDRLTKPCLVRLKRLSSLEICEAMNPQNIKTINRDYDIDDIDDNDNYYFEIINLTALQPDENLLMISGYNCAVCKQIGSNLSKCCVCKRLYHRLCHCPSRISVYNTQSWKCTLCLPDDDVRWNCQQLQLNLYQKNVIPVDFKHCERLLLELFCHNHSLPFHNPVDPKLRKYYEEIQFPIDLSTIKEKLYAKADSKLKYENIYQFLLDVRLLFKNCFQSKSSPIYSSGFQLALYFEKRRLVYFPQFARHKSLQLNFGINI